MNLLEEAPNVWLAILIILAILMCIFLPVVFWRRRKKKLADSVNEEGQTTPIEKLISGRLVKGYYGGLAYKKWQTGTLIEVQLDDGAKFLGAVEGDVPELKDSVNGWKPIQLVVQDVMLTYVEGTDVVADGQGFSRTKPTKKVYLTVLKWKFLSPQNPQE